MPAGPDVGPEDAVAAEAVVARSKPLAAVLAAVPLPVMRPRSWRARSKRG
jgi:hypothetical protein